MSSNMFVIRVCRICLRSDLKLYNVTEFNLNKYYQELVGEPISTNGRLPYHLCCECAALLQKFHKFKEKSDLSNKMLRKCDSRRPIGPIAVKNIIAKNKNIYEHGTLQILILNDRVKTFEENHSEDVDEDDESCDKEDAARPLDCYDDFYSDDDKAYEDPIDDPVGEEAVTKKEIFNQEKVVDVLESQLVNSKDSLEIKPEIEPPKSPKDSSTEKPENTLRKVTKRKLQQNEDDFSTDDEDDEDFEEVKPKKKSPTKPSQQKKFKFENKGHNAKVLAFLNSGHWKKSAYSEEEAVREFEAMAHDKKYLAAAFKCTMCYRGFSAKNMLDRHIPMRHGEAAGTQVCRFCKMRFKSPYYLNKHMRQHYAKYECLRCSLVCNLETSAMFHEEYHNGVLRKCPHCLKEFRHLSSFYTHLRTHRSKHMCSLCGESFVSDKGLIQHKRLKHAMEPVSQPTAAVSNTYCEKCQIKFETKDAFDKHLVHSAMHTDDNKLLGDIPDFFDEDEDNEKSVPLINRRTRVEKTLSAVRKTKCVKPRQPNFKKPTTCHQCGKHFDTQAACRKHHMAEHPRTSFYSEKERVICEVCGTSLAPGSVLAHMNQHTRSKMYTCDTCGKSFTTSIVLKNHIVTHTGERNYPCNVCGKRFTQSGSLYLHHRTVHLKQPYPKRNRKVIEEPNTEAGPFGGKDENRVWRHYFDNSTYTNS